MKINRRITECPKGSRLWFILQTGNGQRRTDAQTDKANETARIIEFPAGKRVLKAPKGIHRVRKSSSTDTSGESGDDDGGHPARQFLAIEEVAGALWCSVDHVRRIPRHALPYSRVGKRNIYRPADLDAYVIIRRIGSPLTAKSSPSHGSLINSLADSVRGRSQQNGERHV